MDSDLERYNETRRLAWHFARLLYSSKHKVGFISRYDFGKKIDGRPRRMYKTETLLEIYKGQRKLPKFTLTHVREHVFEHETFYFTCDSRSPLGMIGMDQDAHHQEPDIDSAVSFAREVIHPSVYDEVSTNARGYHWYLFVDKEGRDNQANIRLRNVCLRLQAALHSLLTSKGFVANSFEVKGYCSCWIQGKYVRAPIIKLPRLKGGFSDLETLRASGIIKISDLEATVARIERILETDHPVGSSAAVRAGEDPGKDQKDVAGYAGSPEIGEANNDEGKLAKEEDREHGNEDQEQRDEEKKSSNRSTASYMGGTYAAQLSPDDPDSRIRKLWAVIQFCKRNSRKATHDDVDAVYQIYLSECKLGKNTEAERKRRIIQAIDACKWKPLDHPYAFSPGKYLPLVRQMNIPPLEFQWSRRNTVNETRLADFVALKVQDAFLPGKITKYEGTASRNATIENSRALKQKGLLTWVVTEHMYTKLLDIAKKYELLQVYRDYEPPVRDSKGQRVLIDATTPHRGRARLIGPGPALRTEYAAFQTIWKRIQQSQKQSA